MTGWGRSHQDGWVALQHLLQLKVGLDATSVRAVFQGQLTDRDDVHQVIDPKTVLSAILLAIVPVASCTVNGTAHSIFLEVKNFKKIQSGA